MKNKFCYAIAISFIFINTAYAEKALTLDECKSLALQNNISIRNGSLEMESARKVKSSAFTKYFPRVSAGAFAFKMKDPVIDESVSEVNLPVYDGNPASLATASEFAYFPGMDITAVEKGKTGYASAVQPVFAGGRIFNGNRLASIGVEVSELKNKMYRDEVLLGTEEQYWQIVSLNEKMKTVLRYEELLDRLSKQVEDAYNAGISMKNDVLKVRQKKNEVELNKSKLENGMQLASMAFCQYIGVPYDPSIVFTDKVVIDDKPESIYIDSSKVIANRNEYKLLKICVEAEELKTKLKLGEYMPEIGVGVGAFYTKIDDYDWIDNKMVFASATIPVSDWWDATYSLKERKTQEKIQENNKKDKTELLLLQMEKAWTDLGDAYRQLSLSEVSRAQAEENLNVSRDSFNNGVTDISDLLEAQAVFQQAEDQLIGAKSSYRVKQIYYMQVTGRGF